MIKQIATKKIDATLTVNLKGFALNQIKQFLPSQSYRSPVAFPKSFEKKSLLPPLASKPPLPIADVKVEIPKVLLPEIEEGFLLMGDVITLIAVESKDIPDCSGIITGDGIAHNFLDCIPTLNFLQSETVQFRLSLFRIEPVRQYGYNKVLRTYTKLPGFDEQKAERLKEIEIEENLDNENEAELSYGKVLAFGERIQLKHIHSNSFVTTSREVSKERGCLQVILDPLGNEGS